LQWCCFVVALLLVVAEDPATGIAAAALAASLQLGTGTDGNPSTTFHMYQGTAMGRPSLIQVVNLLHHEATTTMSPGMTSSCVSRTTNVSFGLRGYVEIDDCCSVSVG
jgi:predicted PhzF superfamily epimerase YddE/YHI9